VALLQNNYGTTYEEVQGGGLLWVVQPFLSFAVFVRLVMWLENLAAVTALVMGLLLFWQKSAERANLFFSATLVLMAPFLISDNLETWNFPSWLAGAAGLGDILGTLFLVAFSLFFYLFPDGQFTPRWTRWTAWAALLGAASWLAPFTFPDRLPAVFQETGWLVLVFSWLFSTVIAVAGQFYRYRYTADAGQRQQIKWVVFAFGLNIAILLWSFFGSFLNLPSRMGNFGALPPHHIGRLVHSPGDWFFDPTLSLVGY
jgi:hypothetical protein